MFITLIVLGIVVYFVIATAVGKIVSLAYSHEGYSANILFAILWPVTVVYSIFEYVLDSSFDRIIRYIQERNEN